jgi:lactoylglutathione lyase
MEFNNIRLLVEHFDECFNFYSEKLGFNPTWGKPGGDYASFDIGVPSGLSIFKSDLMAATIGNSELKLPENSREKVLINFKVDDVDEKYQSLLKKGVEFVNQPADMTGWGIRVVHLRDPEGNLLEIWSELDKSKWDKDLQDEAKEYE